MANLTGARLEGADLLGSKLLAANLTNARLRSTNFYGATFGRTRLLAVLELERALGLSATLHAAPSTIDVGSLLAIPRPAPTAFLAGIGLPERFVTYFDSLFFEPVRFASCFISHAHCDASFAVRLHDSLVSRGVTCWLDERSVHAGEIVYDAIAEGIRLSERVVLCASEEALTSWWVDNELQTLFEKERRIMQREKRKKSLLIPILLDDYLLSDEYRSGKAAEVRQRAYIDFRGCSPTDGRWAENIEKLVAALRQENAAEATAPSDVSVGDPPCRA
jgi:hypothetical protein